MVAGASEPLSMTCTIRSSATRLASS
jgi:hypothetical protein